MARRNLDHLGRTSSNRDRGTITRRARAEPTWAAVSGDLHSLPTTMATVALRSEHWHVHHLGADLPADQLIAFCADHDVALAVITVTQPDIQRVADSTARDLRAAGTPTIVGGAGHDLDELIERARSELD